MKNRLMFGRTVFAAAGVMPMAQASNASDSKKERILVMERVLLKMKKVGFMIKLLVFLSFLVLWMRQAVAVVAPDSTDSIVPASTPVAYDEMTIAVVETRSCDDVECVISIDTLREISFVVIFR